MCNVYFRDLSTSWASVMPALVLRHADRLPGVARARGRDGWAYRAAAALYELNPMTRFVEAFRDVLYDLRFPHC